MTAVAEGTVSPGAARPHRKPLLRSEQAQGLALISPTLAYALILLVAPITVVIAYSFWTQDYLTVDRTFTLEQYRVALTEPIYRDLLMRSLWVSLLVSFFTVVLAYPIAYYISFHGGSHKSLWLFLITIPFWTSYLLRVMSWKVILGYNGVLNSGLMGLGIIDEPSTAFLYNTSRRRHHARPCLGVLRRAADLRVARKGRPHADRGGDRSRRRPDPQLPARHAAAVAARRHLGDPDRHDPDGRRLRHAQARRRQGRRHDRHRHRDAVQARRQLAAGCRTLGRHHDWW